MTDWRDMFKRLYRAMIEDDISTRGTWFEMSDEECREVAEAYREVETERLAARVFGVSRSDA